MDYLYTTLSQKKSIHTGADNFYEFLWDTVNMASLYYSNEILQVGPSVDWKDWVINRLEPGECSA